MARYIIYNNYCILHNILCNKLYSLKKKITYLGIYIQVIGFNNILSYFTYSYPNNQNGYSLSIHNDTNNYSFTTILMKYVSLEGLCNLNSNQITIYSH